MILQSESGLTSQEYSDVVAAFGDPIAKVSLEQYSLSLVQQVGGGAGAANTSFDAIVVGDVVVRAWATTDTITVEALASEDAGDEAWASQNLTATNIDLDVGLTLAASGDTVRVFWWDGTTIKYFESLDNGTTWGAAQSVYAKGNVYLLAATSLTRVHIFSQQSGGSYRLHVGEYNGSWAETDSDIYWPFLPGSFDAISVSALDDGAAATSDILAFSTDFPPMVQVGVENTLLTRDYERVRGIAIIRFQNGRWSDHYSVDLIDNLYGASEREYVRLSNYDDLLFLTYRRIDGDSDYAHSSVAVTRSKTGIHWEQPYLLGDITNSPAMLLKRSVHAYIVSAEDTWRSPSSGYVGDSQVTQDVSDRVISLTSRMGDIQEMQIALSNPEGVLDSTSPLGDDVAIQAIIREGWIVGGAELLVQTAIVDIDSISQSLQIPTDHKILVSRDVLARLMTTNADYVQEWQSQQVSGDNYQGADATKYSGMHHTAAILGHWETEDNTLKLSSSKVPGVAFHTGVSNAWNGTVRAKCKSGATDSADYVGVVFRAYDYENLWYAVYDADNDVVKLVERRLNVDTLVAESGAMGWSHNQFYGLQVDFRYNKLAVYTSADFITYLSQLSYTMQGVSVPGAAWGDIPILSGAMGYLGFGFSEVQTGGWPTTPDPPPWPEDPVVVPSTFSDWPTEMYAGTWEMGIYHTLDMTGPDDPTQPIWLPINAGLPSTDVGGETKYLVRQLMLDPLRPQTVQYCIMGDSISGDAVYRRMNGGTWELRLNTYNIANIAPVPGGHYQFYFLAVNQLKSNAYAGHVYVVIADVGEVAPIYILKSVDYGSTWEYQEIPTRASALVGAMGTMVAYGDLYNISYNNHPGGRTVLAHTSDGGETWYRYDDGLGNSVWKSYLYLSETEFLETGAIYSNSNADVISEFNLAIITNYNVIQFTAQMLPSRFNGFDPSYTDFHLGPERTDAMWMSPYNSSIGRLLRDGIMWRTVNKWYDFEGFPVVPDSITPPGFGSIRVPTSDDDKIFLGRDTSLSSIHPGHVYVTDDETNTAPIDKSGIDPDNVLTSVSIPYTGSGLCFEGMQPVIWL